MLPGLGSHDSLCEAGSRSSLPSAKIGHSFTLQTFLKLQLCARLCVRHWEQCSEKDRMRSALVELTVSFDSALSLRPRDLAWHILGLTKGLLKERVSRKKQIES